jgi:hypothetical protein
MFKREKGQHRESEEVPRAERGAGGENAPCKTWEVLSLHDLEGKRAI